MNKIIWRVRNNIYFMNSTGAAAYLGREKYYPSNFKLKKYLFIPYSLLIIPVLIDSVIMAISRNNIYYILHVPLSFFTSLLIIYYFILSKFNVDNKMKSYDNSIEIFSKNENNGDIGI